MAELKKNVSNPRGLGHSNNYFCTELSSFFIASAQLNSRTTNHHDSFASAEMKEIGIVVMNLLFPLKQK